MQRSCCVAVVQSAAVCIVYRLMSSSKMSPVDANVLHVVRNVLTLLTSIWPLSSLRAATSRPRVPYLITRISSSRHCSLALRSHSASAPCWLPDDVSSLIAVSSSVSSSSSSWSSRSYSTVFNKVPQHRLRQSNLASYTVLSSQV